MKTKKFVQWSCSWNIEFQICRTAMRIDSTCFLVKNIVCLQGLGTSINMFLQETNNVVRAIILLGKCEREIQNGFVRFLIYTCRELYNQCSRGCFVTFPITFMLLVNTCFLMNWLVNLVNKIWLFVYFYLTEDRGWTGDWDQDLQVIEYVYFYGYLKPKLLLWQSLWLCHSQCLRIFPKNQARNAFCGNSTAFAYLRFQSEFSRIKNYSSTWTRRESPKLPSLVTVTIDMSSSTSWMLIIAVRTYFVRIFPDVTKINISG